LIKTEILEGNRFSSCIWKKHLREIEREEEERGERERERSRIFFPVNCQRQNMMEAAGNGDTVTRSFYGIKIDLS